MPLVLYNTLSRRKDTFEPLDPPRVTFYNCGPTVYDVFHVGNARNFVFADVLRRYLDYSGYEVTFVQNLTDVDDKIINRANQEGSSSDSVARRNTELYFQFADALGVRRADRHPKATEHIGDMIAMIEQLVERGHAYASDGDVFFSVPSYAEYGRLSRKSLEDMQEGDRVGAEVRGRKRSPADFALWKAAKPGEPAWPSPWGEGRPGWHIECSVMSLKHLGQPIDIHSGGADLAFPHHENEIAQSCCATGHEFVRYWVHNGFITFGQSAPAGGGGGEEDAFSEEAARAKVSKSTMTEEQKDLFNIDKALDRFGARALRYFLVSAHYRSPLVFSIETVEDAGRRAERIAHAMTVTDQLIDRLAEDGLAPDRSRAEKHLQAFRREMDDDLNTARALAAASEALTEMNQMRVELDRTGGRPTSDGFGLEQLAGLRDAIREMFDILGLNELLREERASEAEELRSRVIDALIEARNAARAARHFGVADLLRDRLSGLGIRLEDGASGTTWLVEPQRDEPPLGDLMAAGIDARQEARRARAFELADTMRDRLAETGIALEDHASGTTWKRVATGS